MTHQNKRIDPIGSGFSMTWILQRLNRRKNNTQREELLGMDEQTYKEYKQAEFELFSTGRPPADADEQLSRLLPNVTDQYHDMDRDPDAYQDASVDVLHTRCGHRDVEYVSYGSEELASYKILTSDPKHWTAVDWARKCAACRDADERAAFPPIVIDDDDNEFP